MSLEMAKCHTKSVFSLVENADQCTDAEIRALQIRKAKISKRNMVNHCNKIWKEVMVLPSLDLILKNKLSARPKY